MPIKVTVEITSIPRDANHAMDAGPPHDVVEPERLQKTKTEMEQWLYDHQGHDAAEYRAVSARSAAGNIDLAVIQFQAWQANNQLIAEGRVIRTGPGQYKKIA